MGVATKSFGMPEVWYLQVAAVMVRPYAEAAPGRDAFHLVGSRLRKHLVDVDGGRSLLGPSSNDRTL